MPQRRRQQPIPRIRPDEFRSGPMITGIGGSSLYRTIRFSVVVREGNRGIFTIQDGELSVNPNDLIEISAMGRIWTVSIQQIRLHYNHPTISKQTERFGREFLREPIGPPDIWADIVGAILDDRGLNDPAPDLNLETSLLNEIDTNTQSINETREEEGLPPIEVDEVNGGFIVPDEIAAEIFGRPIPKKKEEEVKPKRGLHSRKIRWRKK